MIIDADGLLPAQSIAPVAFIDVLREYNVLIGQPSHSQDSQTTHTFLFQRPEVEVGMWTTFVEGGPVLAFNVRVWPCVWDLVQTDLVVGFGIDMLWAPACAPRNTAVIHSHAIKHLNQKSASTRPNWMSTSVAEGVVLFNRMRADGLYPEETVELGPISQCHAADRSTCGS